MLYTLSCLGILNPSSLPRVNNSECLFVFKLSETIEYKKHSKGLLATSLESRSLILPEAVFLGFINKDSPDNSRFLFRALNESFSIIISPLISNSSGKVSLDNLSGIEFKVFRLVVISSPCTPSPLVRPLIKVPFLYRRFTDAPSYFNSQQNSKSDICRTFTILLNHESSSS